MGRVHGLFNPKNASESSGGGSFKEGNCLVTRSVYRVYKKPDYAGKPPSEPVLALVWDVTRLDDDLQPLRTDEGGELKEQIVVSLGGSSLVKAHPGMAEGPESDEAEDLGDAINTEGPTVFVIKEGWFPDKRSGITHLNDSLTKKGFDPKIIDRGWAPDFVGGIYFMKTWIDADNKLPADDKGVERGTPYKIVEKIIRFPYEAKGGKADNKAAKGKKAEATSEPETAQGGSDKEVILSGILNELTEELDGEEVSRKAFKQRVIAKLNANEVDPKLHVPISGLVMDDKWITKNLKKFDMKYDAEKNTIQVGTVPEAA